MGRQVRPGPGAREAATDQLSTARLRLTPLAVADADEMVGVLSGAALYTFTGGSPPGLDELRARYAGLATGRSPDGDEEWRNWIIRREPDRTAVGYVQATVVDGGTRAEIAWVVGLSWQRQGFAAEAVRASSPGWMPAVSRSSRRTYTPITRRPPPWRGGPAWCPWADPTSTTESNSGCGSARGGPGGSRRGAGRPGGGSSSRRGRYTPAGAARPPPGRWPARRRPGRPPGSRCPRGPAPRRRPPPRRAPGPGSAQGSRTR